MSQIVAVDEGVRARGRLLRVEEVAKFLNISRAKAYDLVGSGSLPSLKIGASRRISEESLRRWVEQQEAAS